MDKLYNDFIGKLEKLFGKFEREQKRFEKASNSKIAREVGYSDAQFSRLIHQSATEKEYQRAVQNIERMLIIAELGTEMTKDGAAVQRKSNLWLFASILLLACLGFCIIYIISLPKKNSQSLMMHSPRDYTFKWAFESSFVNPYLKLDDLPDDCNFPCYKYQGKWELRDAYKIPLFREGNGFHYLATEVGMYARCMEEKSPAGNIVEGYEYQKHEIWFDKRRQPINSFISANNELKDSYKNLDFSQNSNFVKVATVHTFFRNEFRIDSTQIYRTGKVIGRDIEFVPSELLEGTFGTKETVRDIENALARITRNLLEDFSKPVSCHIASVPAVNFHFVKDGDIMSFDCQLTTHRFPMDYTKTYVLADQYIKNDCRSLK